MPKAKKPRLLITNLLAQGVQQKKIAEVVGCSHITVSRIATEIKREAEANGKTLDAYHQQLNSIVPIADRAQLMNDIARNSDQDMVRLKTLMRIDELCGIVTEKDKLRSINNNTDGWKQLPPMFVLSPGSTLNLTNNQQKLPEVTSADSPHEEQLQPQDVVDGESEDVSD